jgi:catechol 2,3-dioxygenase-like lactoylglutathione lyase family enzyme
MAAYPCLCVDDVERSVAFYVGLLELIVDADLGWYVELGRPGAAGAGRHGGRGDVRGDVVVALVACGHPSVPAGFDHARGGVLVSVQVPDADRLARQAETAGVPIAQPCRDEDFGQRHFVAVDPDGFLVDVIERIPPTLAVRRQLVEGRRRRRP